MLFLANWSRIIRRVHRNVWNIPFIVTTRMRSGNIMAEGTNQVGPGGGHPRDRVVAASLYHPERTSSLINRQRAAMGGGVDRAIHQRRLRPQTTSLCFRTGEKWAAEDEWLAIRSVPGHCRTLVRVSSFKRAASPRNPTPGPGIPEGDSS